MVDIDIYAIKLRFSHYLVYFLELEIFEWKFI